MLRFGKINTADPVKGRYRVEFEADGIITAPIPYVTKNTLQNKTEDPLSVGESVVCVMDDYCEDGIILGAYNDKENLPVFGDKNQSGVTYKDGTFIKYDTDAKKWTASFEGDVEILKAVDIKIAANLVEFNGGGNGELININDITTKLNARFTLFKNSIIAAFTAQTAIDGSLGVNAFNTAISSDAALNKNDYKNTKVTH